MPADRDDATAELLPGMFAVARFALWLGEVKRTAVFHADQTTPESVAEHTVMLCWLAPALADRLYPDLDVGLVASFAALHDMPEVYAGDTATVRPLDKAALETKARREAHAVDMIGTALLDVLPWVPTMLLRYEAQDTREARFVKAVDKLLPKLVHRLDGGTGLRVAEVTRAEWRAMADAQRASLSGYAEDFPKLLELHRILCDQVLNTVRFGPDSDKPTPQPVRSDS